MCLFIPVVSEKNMLKCFIDNSNKSNLEWKGQNVIYDLCYLSTFIA